MGKLTLQKANSAQEFVNTNLSVRTQRGFTAMIDHAFEQYLTCPPCQDSYFEQVQAVS